MKEINEQDFKKGNYVLSVYIDKNLNKFINVLDLDLMENTYYVEELN